MKHGRRRGRQDAGPGRSGHRFPLAPDSQPASSIPVYWSGFLISFVLGIIVAAVDVDAVTVSVAALILLGWVGVVINRAANLRRQSRRLVLGPRHLVPVVCMLGGLQPVIEELPEDRPVWLDVALVSLVLAVLGGVVVAGLLLYLRGIRKVVGTLPPGTKWLEFPVYRLGRELAGEGVAFHATEPGAEPELLAPPAPAVPTPGWWLDPDDPSLIRYHDGERWTDEVGRSTAPRPEWPGHQGIFLAGAGPDGISTGRPLRPGKGRYLSVGQVWGLIGVLTVGIVVAGFQPILGGLVIAGALGTIIVSAWRAGYRPTLPGTARHPFRPTTPEEPEQPAG